MDPNGARLLTGAYDYNLKMWDFAGMDANFRSFRTTTPCGSNRVRSAQRTMRRCEPRNLRRWRAECGKRGARQISDIQWSITGDRFLVAPAASQSAQAKCFDREGAQLYECVGRPSDRGIGRHGADASPVLADRAAPRPWQVRVRARRHVPPRHEQHQVRCQRRGRPPRSSFRSRGISPWDVISTAAGATSRR